MTSFLAPILRGSQKQRGEEAKDTLTDTHKQTHTHTHRDTNTHTHKQTHRHTETDAQRQTDRKTGNTQTDKHPHTDI